MVDDGHGNKSIHAPVANSRQYLVAALFHSQALQQQTETLVDQS